MYKEGYNAGKWRTWTDCHKLIMEHDEADDILDVVEEGLEAFGADPYEDDGDDGGADPGDGGMDGDEDGGEDCGEDGEADGEA